MMKSWKLGAALFALALAGSITACGKKEAPASTEPAAVEQKAAISAWGVDTTQGDPAVKPGDDFSRYANGKWLDTFVMPPDLSSYGTFVQLRLDAEADVREIVEEVAAKDAAIGSLEQKVGGYFKSWMNEVRLNELGAAPLKPHLDAIYAIDSADDLNKAYASLHGSAPFGVGIIPDPADTTKYIAFVGQSGLGLPDRDYYLKTDERFVQYRAAYKDYISKVLSL
ncbi:MAG: M13 family metallopeptidase N-terminal domain-containing protein, partial [Parvularculaceae bacterium]